MSATPPSKKRKPWRYRWPDDTRDDVLARRRGASPGPSASEEAPRPDAVLRDDARMLATPGLAQCGLENGQSWREMAIAGYASLG